MAATHAAALALDTDEENDKLYTTPRRRSKSKSDSKPTLTPPETPITGARPSTSALSSSDSVRNTGDSHYNKDNDEIIEFLHDLEIAQDANGRYIEFGRGVWSAVYKATSTLSLAAGIPQVDSPFTPPASPTPSALSLPSSSPGNHIRSTGNHNRCIFAVKTPLRRDAQAVHHAEARILSLISRRTKEQQQKQQQQQQHAYTVPFQGYIPWSHSLVLQAVPLTLASHIEERAHSARRHFSTKTMFEPVLSSAHWRDLAMQLIRGLDWLHNVVGVVHGDIKPHNILLRRRADDNNIDDGAEFQYDALYADFSSAHCISSSSSSNSSSVISALTPPFAAPELMSVAALRSELCCTPASDVFALALTLLAGATGETMVYASGVSEMQRLAMSREGYRALDYVRSGPNASRVVRGGMVERTVAPAVRKEPGERVGAGEWVVC